MMLRCPTGERAIEALREIRAVVNRQAEDKRLIATPDNVRAYSWVSLGARQMAESRPYELR